jgi:class 3 adenylate cyclase
MRPDPQTEAGVRKFLDDFLRAYEAREADRLASMFVQDDDIVLIGSGEDERLFSPLQLRQAFQRDVGQISELRVELLWASVSARDSVAWVASESWLHWETRERQGKDLSRTTLVLEKRDGRWLAAHVHTSSPDPRQRAGQSWPTAVETLATAAEAEHIDLAAHAAPDGTLTLLFTDIEGSTQLAESLGDARWLDLLRRHNNIVREEIRNHGCFEVKSQGDGFMIVSQSARRAIRCAIAVQRKLLELGGIRVRAGLHTGDVLKEGEDYFGKNVILASRIANEADGGQVLVSSLVKEIAESSGEFEFGQGREVSLKGLSQLYTVYEVSLKP